MDICCHLLSLIVIYAKLMTINDEKQMTKGELQIRLLNLIPSSRSSFHQSDSARRPFFRWSKAQNEYQH